MFRKILFVLAVIIAIPLVAALFVKQDYGVTTSISINKPVAQVFDYVKLLKNQDNYSVWAKMDPDMKQTFRGTDGTVGFVSAWASDKEEVGSGEQEIIAITEGKRIDYELRFITPFAATDRAFMTTEAVEDDETLVGWGFVGHIDYPMNLMLLFVDLETMVGKDLQQGLNQLKVILEKQ
ncbi:SRPBCC family protein [Shewanella salipaludis]|uniref:SRPBCC family protein n=1 Tax=Shewanella salipaludis TaxID=2723052 RepID=A0A972FTI2_9GAMM|nr:SRPBCC family protein [Shewanella salipaludis]NMH64954.1 SRPBCC family protein [Shewanella salipaludis]